MGEVPSSEEEEEEIGTVVTLLPRYVLPSEEGDEESVEEDLPPAQHWTVLSPMQ